MCEETRHLYKPVDDPDSIILFSPKTPNWAAEVLPYVSLDKSTALLRFSNENARSGANDLTANGLKFVYIPQTPIADITTETAWLYLAIAKYIIVEKYSAYDLISEIPVEGNESRKTVSAIKKLLSAIKNSTDSEQAFNTSVCKLAEYLGYDTRNDHLRKLYKTICDISYHVSFDPDQYQNIAITFHSSKGLEFDQVIVFADDYRLSDMQSIYNHYVAVTRAKTKLIIVKQNNYSANCFQINLEKIFSNSTVNLERIITFA